MSNQIALSVQMTTEGAVVCQRCKKSLPPGTELVWIHSTDRKLGGRNCCPECDRYYQEKKKGMVSSTNRSMLPQISSSQREYDYKKMKSENLLLLLPLQAISHSWMQLMQLEFMITTMQPNKEQVSLSFSFNVYDITLAQWF